MKKEASNSARVNAVGTIVDTTQAMLGAAHMQNWDWLAQLEAQRNEMIKMTFCEPPAVDEAANVAAGIEKIIAIDEKITEICKTARDDAAGSLHQLRNTKDAVSAYHSNR